MSFTTPWSQEDTDRAAEMIRDNASLADVAQAVGRSPAAVRKRLAAVGQSVTAMRTVHRGPPEILAWRCVSPPDEPVRVQASVPVHETFRAQETPADPRKDPKLHAPKAPAGYHLRGVSTLLNAAGEPVQTWVKTTQDAAAVKLDSLLEAIKSLPDSFRETHSPKAAPAHLDSDLLCVYPIGDPHFGMYAWRDECGASYDLEIAERLHCEAIARLSASAPAAKHALLISLGDFFHCDSNLARTARSGAPLDTDTRWQLVLKSGVRAFRRMVDVALEKHEQVRVICEIGNHDDYSAVMLAMAMDAFYERDERVTVDTSPEPFHYHRFGKCFIGVTHGSECKPGELPGIMAADRPADWGQTKHRYWYTGHVHNEQVREHPGCVVESFRTLAPRDAWAHRSGYRADRDMRVDVLHRDWGRVTRNILGVEQVS